MLDRVWVAASVAELHPKSGLKQTDLWLTTAEEDISTLLYRILLQCAKVVLLPCFSCGHDNFHHVCSYVEFVTKKQV